MSGSPDNPPAFPVLETPEVYAKHAGMTLRDWFAGRAPLEPQPWFKPDLPPRPEDKWGHSYSDWRFDTWDAAIMHCQKHGGTPRNLNGEAQIAYDNDAPKQLLIQWPYAWADAMLAERAKNRGNPAAL